MHGLHACSAGQYRARAWRCHLVGQHAGALRSASGHGCNSFSRAQGWAGPQVGARRSLSGCTEPMSRGGLWSGLVGRRPSRVPWPKTAAARGACSASVSARMAHGMDSVLCALCICELHTSRPPGLEQLMTSERAPFHGCHRYNYVGVANAIQRRACHLRVLAVPKLCLDGDDSTLLSQSHLGQVVVLDVSRQARRPGIAHPQHLMKLSS